MKFIEVNNLEIVNCNYSKLKEKADVINEKNKKIKAENKKRSSSSAVSVIMLTLAMLATTGLLMWVVWDRLLRGIENAEFFVQYKMLDPLVFKVIVEIFIVLLCGALYRTGLTLMFATKQANKTPLLSYGDDVLLASVLENRIAGNLNIECTGTNRPYISQPVVFSIDTIGKEKTDILTFKTSEKQWVLVSLPGLFKTIIDVGGRIIYSPYINEDEVVDSAENAYIHEKMQKKLLEDKLISTQEEHAAETKKTREQLRLAKKEIAALEESLLKTRRELEESQTEKEFAETSLREAQNLLAESGGAREIALQERLQAANETERNHFLLQQNYDALKESFDALNLSHSKSLEENKSLLTRVRVADAAILDYERKMGEIKRDSEAQLAHTKTDCEEQIAKIQVDCEAQLKAKDDECKRIVSEATKETERRTQLLEDQIRALDDENQQLNETNKKNTEVINQLQHNAKADREHYQNIETQYTLATNTCKTLQKELDAYRVKERQWDADKDAIDIQKKAMLDLNEKNALLAQHKKTLEESLLVTKADNERLVDEVKNGNKKVESLERSIEENLKNSQSLQDELTKARASEKELKGALEKLQKDNEALVAINKQNEQVVLSANAQSEKLITLEKENKSLQQSNGDLKSRNRKLFEENRDLNEKTQALDEQYKAAEKARDEAATDLIALQQKNNSLQEYVTSLQFQLNQAQGENKQLSAQLDKAQKDREELRNNYRPVEDQSANFSKLMKEREEKLKKAREDARLEAEKESAANASAK